MTCDLDRPCARCVKRSIGHLCHDEPREPAKAAKVERDNVVGDGERPAKQEGNPENALSRSTEQEQAEQQQLLQGPGLNLSPSALPATTQANPAGLPSSSPVLGAQSQFTGAQGQQPFGYGDWSLGGQNQFHDMHNYHPSYMFNAPEVTNEYNLLNDFLSTSLLDEGGLYSGDDVPGLYSNPSLIDTVAASTNGSSRDNLAQAQARPTDEATKSAPGTKELRTARTMTDKAKEAYYMTAADPSGNDTPEERMTKVLKAKYDAGLLRPFNYINGYARLDQYMDQHMQPASRQKIARQIDKFRPKFRERMKSLTDIELVLVEMWFERSLMEYDRVFASMAVPACCWRRTGEIFRGNREMAELIHVPIEQLRDGKLALHEIIVEAHLVSYWEKFGAIAFDTAQKAMLTSCSLKNPNLASKDPEIHCCFSFTIRRDSHNIPALIVGNFLPQKRSRPS